MAGVAAILAGCASEPVSADLREQAGGFTVSAVATDPRPALGKVVIWGGQIIKTDNTTNGATLMVLELPLKKQERPIEHARARGRFIAQRERLLDPEEFRPGRYVTVAGTIVGTETQPLRRAHYTYPVVRIDEIHLWPELPKGQYYPYPSWGPGPEVWEHGPGWAIPGGGMYY